MDKQVRNTFAMVSIPMELIDDAGISDGDIIEISQIGGKIIIEKANGGSGNICDGDCGNCPISREICDLQCESCACKNVCGGNI